MSTINVLITVDAETIIDQYGRNSDPNNPRFIPDSSNLIYMTTKQDHIKGSPGAELTIKASPGDIIRWRETTLSMNFLYTSVLYKYSSSSRTDLISPPQPRLFKRNEPLPNPNDPLNPTTQQVQNYAWSTEVLQPGSVTYHFNFMLLNEKGVKQGYYYWDPFIEIQD